METTTKRDMNFTVDIYFCPNATCLDCRGINYGYWWGMCRQCDSSVYSNLYSDLCYFCGNLLREPGETCEDWNVNNGDGCSTKC